MKLKMKNMEYKNKTKNIFVNQFNSESAIDDKILEFYVKKI